MVTACNLNSVNNLNAAAITTTNNADIHVKGKDVNPLLLLMMLQANSDDGKELLQKINDAKQTAKKPLEPIYKPLTPITKKQVMNIFLLLAEVEEKNRQANQATQRAILASASEAQEQYNVAVNNWEDAQKAADKAFQDGLKKVSTVNALSLIKDIGIGIGITLVFGAIGAMVGGPIGLGLGLLVGAIVAGVVEGTDKKDCGVTESHEEVDQSKQGDVVSKQTDVKIAESKAQQTEQKANTIMDSEFNPTQQTLTSIFTMYNAFINWYGQLGQIFNGG